jgi:hypothetical protein
LTNDSDIALIKNNAFIGALISVELEKLRKRRIKETCFGSVSYKEFDHMVRGSSTSDKKGFHSCSVKADFEEESKPFEVNYFNNPSSIFLTTRDKSCKMQA